MQIIKICHWARKKSTYFAAFIDFHTNTHSSTSVFSGHGATLKLHFEPSTKKLSLLFVSSKTVSIFLIYRLAYKMAIINHLNVRYPKLIIVQNAYIHFCKEL